MRRVATPAELVQWSKYLEPLAADRRSAVIADLSEVVADCPLCDEPVRRCDPRSRGAGGLVHLGCCKRGPR